MRARDGRDGRDRCYNNHLHVHLVKNKVDIEIFSSGRGQGETETSTEEQGQVRDADIPTMRQTTDGTVADGHYPAVCKLIMSTGLL